MKEFRVNKFLTSAVLGVAMSAGSMAAVAADTQPASAPTTAPAAVAATAPTTAPAKVLALVGKIQITQAQVDKIIAAAGQGIPADKMDMVRQRVLDHLISQEQIKLYTKAHNMVCTDKDLADEKAKIEEIGKKMNMSADQLMASNGITDDMLRDRISQRKLFLQAIAKPNLEAMVKQHPEYCDGTVVAASHILISCNQYASEADQKAALAKLQQIAADIKAGKIKFEDAAKQFSDCPSKEKGGDLGEFSYGQMVPAFAAKAFSMKVNEISDPVRSPFGYHLIKVTAHRAATSKPDEETMEEAAKAVIAGQLQEQIVAETLVTNPVTLVK